MVSYFFFTIETIYSTILVMLEIACIIETIQYCTVTVVQYLDDWTGKICPALRKMISGEDYFLNLLNVVGSSGHGKGARREINKMCTITRQSNNTIDNRRYSISTAVFCLSRKPVESGGGRANWSRERTSRRVMTAKKGKEGSSDPPLVPSRRRCT